MADPPVVAKLEVLRGALKMAWTGLRILAGAFAFVSTLHAMQSAEYIVYIVQHHARLDGWAALSALDIALAVVGIAGSWMALRRRVHIWAVPFFLLVQLPIPTIIGASRCDTLISCRLIGWAALPASMLN